MSRPLANGLVSKLRYKVTERKNLKAGGPQNRHKRIQQIVTGLIRHERLELHYIDGDEARGYVERIISDAIRHGDRHVPTMEMASYWITEKPLIHKLFQVLAPRYKDYNVSYTKLWRAPRVHPGHGREKCVLELRSNMYPPLGPDRSNYKNLIHNVLLREAKKFFDNEKAMKGKIADYALRAQASTLVNNEKSTSSDTINADSDTVCSESESSEKVSNMEENVKVESLSTSSSNTVKESSESQNENVTLGRNENLNLDKMNIKDELPSKEK